MRITFAAPKCTVHDFGERNTLSYCVVCGASSLELSRMATEETRKYYKSPDVASPPATREEKMERAIKRVLATARYIDAGIHHVSSDNIAALKEALK